MLCADAKKLIRENANFENLTHLTNLETALTKNYHFKYRMKTIEENRLQIYTLQEQFKEMISSYQETQNKAALKEAIEIYIDQIIPREQDNQVLQYSTLYVDVEIGGNLLDDSSKSSNKHDGDIKFILCSNSILLFSISIPSTNLL